MFPRTSNVVIVLNEWFNKVSLFHCLLTENLTKMTEVAGSILIEQYATGITQVQWHQNDFYPDSVLICGQALLRYATNWTIFHILLSCTLHRKNKARASVYVWCLPLGVMATRPKPATYEFENLVYSPIVCVLPLDCSAFVVLILKRVGLYTGFSFTLKMSFSLWNFALLCVIEEEKLHNNLQPQT